MYEGIFLIGQNSVSGKQSGIWTVILTLENV